MKRSVTVAISVLAALGFGAAPATAEAVLNLEFDGVRHSFAPQMEGARTGFTRFLSVDAVSIEGADGPSRLVLELALPPGARTGDAPHDARISFRPDGWRDYWVSPPEFPEGAVVIDFLDLSGPSPRIAGRFSAPLCFTPSPMRIPDPTRCLPASGSFETALARD
ncbi:MAG: hypothetical protein EA385_14420 [Salinarimonadaceae bacterium]|nr:MAG: hypothetical protein EA385_14420 [Salinarimonadaceae bacterium]